MAVALARSRTFQQSSTEQQAVFESSNFNIQIGAISLQLEASPSGVVFVNRKLKNSSDVRKDTQEGDGEGSAWRASVEDGNI